MLRMQLRDADPWADTRSDDDAAGAVAASMSSIWDSVTSVFSSSVPPAPQPGGSPPTVNPPIPNPGGPATTTQVKVGPKPPTPFYKTPIGLILIVAGAFVGWKVYKKRKAA